MQLNIFLVVTHAETKQANDWQETAFTKLCNKTNKTLSLPPVVQRRYLCLNVAVIPAAAADSAGRAIE